jgi:arylsulfatase A-like enzyme
MLSLDGRRKRVEGDAPPRYVTRQLHRRANHLVRTDLAGAGEPFYLQLDELAPHDDHEAQDSCLRTALPGPDKLRPVRWMKLRNAHFERNVSDKPKFVRKLPRLGNSDRAAIEHRMRCRAAAVREIDKGVGRLVGLLKRTGEFDNTAFVFYSDNGYFAGEHGLTKGKGLPYEEAIRVPALIRVPTDLTGGTVPPRRTDSVVSNIDLAPTILDLADAEPCTAGGECRVPDGRSMLPALADPASWPADRPILLEIDQPGRVAGGTLGCTWAGVRQSGQVYVEYERVLIPGTESCRRTDEREHYDLTRDPRQLHNLWPAQSPGHEETQATLADELRTLRTCAGSIAGAPGAPNPCP